MEKDEPFLLGFFRQLISRLRRWYKGKYIPPPKNEPGSGVYVISPGYYHQPPLARMLKRLVQFWLDHWKFLITTTLAASAVYVAWLKLVSEDGF